MQWVLDNWPLLVQIGTGVVTVASLIVRLTPTQKDDVLLTKVLDVLHILALNPKKDK